ncbi:hypothetical protein C4D60_Mb06t10640 [Musa balbisiana]|uniref:Uncharacterized protein n=1 Tax=Musa balbisiana TaxID=52838 RepID=A0A4S8IM93_MUSBA|nr:hypothetical protein C4D60_Mb06t10640 [Musa balbisiana]
MKLIPYVANMEKAMKVKLLEESRQNFLCRCRVYETMIRKPSFLPPQIHPMLWISGLDLLANLTKNSRDDSIVLLLTEQVKDVLFEPVRKAQDAMHFHKSGNSMWLPCGPRHPGAIHTTLQELAAKCLAAKLAAQTPI